MNEPANLPAKGDRNALHRRLWRKLRVQIQASPWFGSAVAGTVAGWLGLVHRTNRIVTGVQDPAEVYNNNHPAIYTMWHGQHFMGPHCLPKGSRVVAMLSKSADAEINARIVEKLGIETVRGSGGRETGRLIEKGGARALILLKRALDQGKSVFMIADISKAEARHAGLGIVTLAKLSGRPIVAVAYASTRKKVLEKTWDKTTINLPFGKAAYVAADPLYIPREASDEDLEFHRMQLDDRLDDAARRAHGLLEQAQ